MAGKPNGGERYDWTKLKTEYVTTRLSLKELAEKHGIRYRTVADRSRKEGWVADRKEYLEKVTQKAVSKAATKQSNALAKELSAANAISELIISALRDPEQFQRHLVQMREKEGKEESWWVEEKVFNKFDMKSLKDAAQALKLVEEMKRSMDNILTMEQKNREEREKRKLDIEERRLALEESKQNIGSGDDEQHGVVILSEILEDEDE
ncbi:MAG: hypothetical protein Q4C46_05535 [Bacillota bacterium]|nr:hypothetical protein [Bacillota bacterium]